MMKVQSKGSSLVLVLILLAVTAIASITFINQSNSLTNQASKVAAKISVNLMKFRIESYLTDISSIEITASNEQNIKNCFGSTLSAGGVCGTAYDACISAPEGLCTEAAAACEAFDSCATSGKFPKVPADETDDHWSQRIASPLPDGCGITCKTLTATCENHKSSCRETQINCQRGATEKCRVKTNQEFVLYNFEGYAVSGGNVCYDKRGDRLADGDSNCVYKITTYYSSKCHTPSDTECYGSSGLTASYKIEELSLIKTLNDSVTPQSTLIPMASMPSYTLYPRAGSAAELSRNLGEHLFCAIASTVSAISWYISPLDPGACTVRMNADTGVWTRTGGCKVACIDLN